MELVFFCCFNVVVLLLTTADFMWMSRNGSLKKAVELSIAWIILGLGFSLVVLYLYGRQHFFEYLSAYFIEKSLSVDNIFMFFLIFSQLGIEKKFQHKVLFVGIWTAIVLRAIMIFSVGAILDNFHFMSYLFGLFILYAGMSTLRETKRKASYSKLLQRVSHLFPVFHGDNMGKFLVTDNQGKTYATTLTIALIMVEISDIVFAFDSVPALFSITNDRMIIYSSNILAIIGLRSLYGVFAEIVDTFTYVKYGVSLILIFVGVKMLCADFFTMNAAVSLCIICLVLALSVVISVAKRK